jgi:UDP-GlcNAc:undecaprenyl-phosphate GlcNAc-1-phosphate transferase
MSTFQISLAGGIMLLIELIYFRIARKFHIVDIPNDRSLHQKPTIRGGGVIFFFAAWLYYLVMQDISLLFIVGLTMVSVVGFLDDVLNLRTGIRLVVQLMSFIVLFYDVHALSAFGIPFTVLIIVIAMATLNAYNFMDGINGITGGYSLVVLSGLLYVNTTEHLIPTEFLLVLSLALLIFNFFNFRTRAFCFAGDVGSTSIAYIIFYVITLLVVATGNFAYILFLAVYGVDSALTIFHRILRRENILKPHRTHLYQVIVHHYKMPHMLMTGAYMVVQLIVTCIVISNLGQPLAYQYFTGLIIIATLSIVYILVKWRLLTRLRPA